ncbi:MAG: glycosyltransferase, partial [Acidobacteriota bacterium]
MIEGLDHRDHVPDIVAGLRRTAAEEIIVCEDGSIDGSLQAWTDLLDRPNDFVVRSNDLHELRAYDRAMTLARGEIVCLLQDDDIPPEDTSWYDHSVALFERYPKLVMIGGCIGFSGLETCTAISDEHPYAPGDITSVYGETPDYETKDGIPFMFVEGINVGPVFIRKKPFLEIGGFDMSYSPVGWPAIHFDIEMSLRVWREGGQVGWFPMPFAQRGMPGTKSFGHLQKRLDQLQRNAAKLHESFDDLLPTISEQVARANATLVQRK